MVRRVHSCDMSKLATEREATTMQYAIDSHNGTHRVVTDANGIAAAVAAVYPNSVTITPLGEPTDTAHRYTAVYGGEVWCDTHDSAFPCTVTDNNEAGE